jgi:hypothetical protein
MWTLELGLLDKFIEVALVARPGHLTVCGCKKSPKGVSLIIFSVQIIFSSKFKFCKVSQVKLKLYKYELS